VYVVPSAGTALNGQPTAHKTLNLQLNASDGVALGAWFVLSDTYYLAQAPAPGTLTAHLGAALRAHPTVLFLHGNAASRAVPYRVQHAKAWSRMGANVLALDYRGFGDSAGTPSEPGLARDAQAAWAWLRAHGAEAERVAVVGHSLGTAVATQLVHEVEREGERPRGLVLLAPFASLRTLVDSYYVLGLFPLMKPLELIPGAQGM
jgi:abhydrolase domain-containing protein 12